MIQLPPMLPKKPKRDNRVRSRAHLNWVKSHRCSVPECARTEIEAAHVRNGTDGGAALKPGDCWTISLCRPHHVLQHQVGEERFQRMYGIDMKALAEAFWRADNKNRRAWEAKQRKQSGGQ